MVKLGHIRQSWVQVVNAVFNACDVASSVEICYVTVEEVLKVEKREIIALVVLVLLQLSP